MPVNNQELLIDHLDKTLQGEALPEAEALIARDSEAREEWQYLQSAVDAVQHAALHAKVAAIREEMQSTPVVSIQRPVVRNMTRRMFRIAAAVVLLVGAVAVYKFATVSSESFYNDHYSSYTLSTARGEGETSLLEQAYRNNNWNEVVTQYNALAAKTNKDHFLAGVAAMELKQYTQAIERFNAVLNSNTGTGDSYFQDEAEYYLALAYIANKQTKEADSLLRKIKADNGHLYQQKANNMLGLDWKIVEFK
jgi:tetratricopeptide (TPR) repeat protein